MASISLPVGIRDLVTRVASRQGDQQTIIDLLASIPALQGGMMEAMLLAPMSAGPDAQCPPELAAGITAFQTFWIARGVLRVADGVVDPGGSTLRQLNAVAGLRPVPKPVTNPDVITFGDMTFEQVNQANKAGVHEVSNRTIEPLSLGMPLLIQSTKVTRIQELRFKVTKPDGVFWVGVGVPEGTVEFGRAFVFFHPTPIQAGKVRAADSDYPNFVGGWVSRIEKYMPRNTGQLALSRKLPMVLPYMTMASAKVNPRVNVFADRPLETIAGVLAASRQILTGSFNDPPLTALSTGSFSSGSTFHAGFLGLPGVSDMVVECVDFDSTFIIDPTAHVVPPAGTRFVQFTQSSTRAVRPNRFDLPPPRWAKTSFPDLEFHDELPVHNKIGFMLYWASTLMSSLT